MWRNGNASEVFWVWNETTRHDEKVCGKNFIFRNVENHLNFCHAVEFIANLIYVQIERNTEMNILMLKYYPCTSDWWYLQAAIIFELLFEWLPFTHTRAEHNFLTKHFSPYSRVGTYTEVSLIIYCSKCMWMWMLKKQNRKLFHAWHCSLIRERAHKFSKISFMRNYILIFVRTMQ